MSNKKLIGGAILVVVGLLAFGKFYGRGASSSGIASIHNNIASVGAAPQNNENSAPDFSLSKLGGGTITLSEYKDKKPVILVFWASWCPNCRRNIPHLNGFYEKYKDKIEVIGINLQESESTVQGFVSSAGVTFPIALDPDGQVSNSYGVRSTNTHVLIGKNGNLVRTIPGDIQESDIASLIR